MEQSISSSVDLVDVLEVAWDEQSHRLLLKLVRLVSVRVREAEDVTFDERLAVSLQFGHL